VERAIKSADDYLQYVGTALDEAMHEVDSAATVFVESEAQRQLGEALGQARNALTRARRDLDAHMAREIRREDRSSAETYFAELGLTDGEQPQIVAAVVPMPLEEERIPLDKFAQRTFQNDFTNWVTRFNNDERRHPGLPFLMEVPGGTTPSVEGERFRFLAFPQGGSEPLQVAWLYTTAAFVFKHRLYSWQDPPRYAIGLLLEEVRATIKFVWRLYEELHVVPRAVAVQCAVANVPHFNLMTPENLGGVRENAPNDGLSSIVAPVTPIVLPFRTDDAMITRALANIESVVRANYHPPAFTG
jgi:hypothetical protein